MKFVQFIVALLFASAVFAQNAWLSGTAAANTNTVVDAGFGQLASLTIADTSGSANTIIIYDTDSATSTNRTLPAYTGRVQSLVTNTTTWIDSVGRTNSRSVVRLTNAVTTFAAVTNQANILYRVTVPANSTLVLEPPSPLGYTYGLTIRPTGAAQYTTRLIRND